MSAPAARGSGPPSARRRAGRPPPFVPLLLLLAAAQDPRCGRAEEKREAPAASPVAETLPAHRAARRERLRAALGERYALLFGQPLTDSLYLPQEGGFLYLSGVEDAGAALFVAGERALPLLPDAPAKPESAPPPEPSNPPPPPEAPSPNGEPAATAPGAAAPPEAASREILFLRDGGEWYVRFHGPRFLPRPGTEAALGVERVRKAPPDPDAYAGWLARALPPKARLAMPAYASADHAHTRDLRARVAAALARARPDVAVEDLAPALAALRAVKDPAEVEFLRRAARVTAEAVREALPLLRDGGSEADLEGAILHGMRRRGARPAFTFVVGAGVNGATPHYFRNESRLRAGDLVVLDVGASVERYAADVTRCFPVGGRFSPRQREIYELVLRAQEAAIAAVRPGGSFQEVDAAARKIIAAQGFAKHFIHGTSHHVGLDVHDPGPATLAEGMVLTVEPGIYLPDEGFGVRIEDMVLVTRDGGERLSPDLPRTVEEVEALLAPGGPR